MKTLFLLTATGLLFLSCKKEMINDQNNETDAIQLTIEAKEASSSARGAMQLSGVGFYATQDECDPVSQGAIYAIKMTGDLEGCLYAFIDEFDCSPSGTYRESGREYFVGTYNGETGTFWTTYKFEGRYEICNPDGSPLGAEIFGRCQHPIVVGSGDGVFQGVTGRLDFKDDIAAGNFPFRGHLQF